MQSSSIAARPALSPSQTVDAASEGDLRPGTLSPAQLRQAYRHMLSSRLIDDREILMKRQNRIYFQVSAAGHEAAQTAAGMALQAGHDWFYPYYRDRALCLALGVTAEEMFLQGVGAARDTASGGRQMPSHWSDPAKHIVTGSSPTGTQFLQAIGCAHASKLRQTKEVTLVCTGDGATSEGEFWESINIATLDKLPLLYLIEDNGWAISVPVERQTPGGSISKLLEAFPNLLRLEVDGCDFVASYEAMQTAAAWVRQGNGPAVVHASVTRPYSHSLSDDDRLYKSVEERDEESARDPLPRMADYLVEKGVATREELDRLSQELFAQIDAVSQAVQDEPPPATDSVLRHLYSETVDPTGPRFEATPVFTGEPRTMVDEINLTLHEEMRRDERVLMFGEDVADCSREENLPALKGKGGVFKATLGLQRVFGSDRCFNTTLAEAGIMGRAIGLATRGFKPITEIQFFDYIWPAMMQIRDELAIIRWRSHGGFSCPVVIRVATGGYLTGGAVYHSQNGESVFTHIPGLRVVMPSNALDACGLLRTAIRADDPVLFLEHKKLYREPYNRSPHPGPDYTIPFGKARIMKAGESLTMVTYGALVQKCLLAAARLEESHPGRTVEVIDLRSLSPYDWPAIAESVRKTSRVMVAHEDTKSWGFGAEIAARIADELFCDLDAPVGRVAAQDTWVAYHPTLEDAILPQVDDVVREGERLLRF
ncbi:MAG: dehydrogenase E1 component subunit alpha/beta [Bryobacteraceae bacterium]|nr:dehydrogenase E1 component subunit alpha/beta [Bryobacteraceae bacterium]